MSTATSRAPAPRYALPPTPPSFVITPDDEAIIWHVYRHRLIDAEMLRSLLPHRSRQKVTRRLNTLRQAQVIDRIGRHGRRRPTGGSFPEVYALGLEGAKWLKAQGLPIKSRYWTQRNRELRGMSVEHLLETTRFMVSLECSVQRRGTERLIHLDEILRETEENPIALNGLPTTIRTPLAWREHDGNEGTAADKIFGLEKKRDRKTYSYFFLEIDRGTETIMPNERRIDARNFFRETSFLRKMVIYAHAFESGAHKKRYGMPSFRVLTVTTSSDRVALMQQAYQKYVHPVGRSGLFLFTDEATLLQADDILSVPFATANGSTIYLGD